MKKIASGRRGEIFVDQIGGKTIATKKALDDSKKASINKEIVILSKLNDNNIDFVPQIIEQKDGEFSYEYIVGEPFNKVFGRADVDTQNVIVRELISKAYELDKLGVVHGELIRPYSNVLVSPSLNVSIIDFERGGLGDFSGKNLRSLSQWLMAVGYLSLKDVKVMRTLKNVDLVHDFIVSTLRNKDEKDYLKIFSYILLLLSIDILTKYLFYDLRSGADLFFINPIINLGISWSIPLDLNISIIVALIAIFLFIYMYVKNHMGKIVFILFMSGSLGNLFDRIFVGGVRDFIDVGFWPIFNFADVFLSIALALFLFKEIFRSR